MSSPSIPRTATPPVTITPPETTTPGASNLEPEREGSVVSFGASSESSFPSVSNPIIQERLDSLVQRELLLKAGEASSVESFGASSESTLPSVGNPIIQQRLDSMATVPSAEESSGGASLPTVIHHGRPNSRQRRARLLVEESSTDSAAYGSSGKLAGRASVIKSESEGSLLAVSSRSAEPPRGGSVDLSSHLGAGLLPESSTRSAEDGGSVIIHDVKNDPLDALSHFAEEDGGSRVAEQEPSLGESSTRSAEDGGSVIIHDVRK